MPPRHFSSVLFPLPLRPTMPNASPVETSKLTSRRASSRSYVIRRNGCSARSLSVCTCWWGSSKTFETPSTRTANGSRLPADTAITVAAGGARGSAMILGEGSVIRRRALWRSELAVRGYRFVRRTADRAGLQLVLKTFYSPIPDFWQLPEAAWKRKSEMRGIDWDLPAQLRFLEENLAPHIPDFRWTQEPTGDPHAYYVNNDTFGIVDSTTLFAMVRHLRPRRIVELGSGFTTLTLGQAARANAADGH